MCVNGDGRRRFKNIYRRGSLHTTPKIETVKNFWPTCLTPRRRHKIVLFWEKNGYTNLENIFEFSTLKKIIKNRSLKYNRIVRM